MSGNQISCKSCGKFNFLKFPQLLQRGCVKGSVIKRAVFSMKEDGEDNTALPVLQDGNSLPLSGIELLEKQT